MDPNERPLVRAALTLELEHADEQTAARIRRYLAFLEGDTWVTMEHERTVTRRAQAGGNMDEETETYLGMVMGISLRYRDRGVPLSKLIAAGETGVKGAARKYDPDRGYKFGTFCSWWIRQRINGLIEDCNRSR